MVLNPTPFPHCKVYIHSFITLLPHTLTPHINTGNFPPVSFLKVGCFFIYLLNNLICKAVGRVRNCLAPLTDHRTTVWSCDQSVEVSQKSADIAENTQVLS